MSLIPQSVMPHIRRFGLSGVVAVAVIVVMLLGINPVTVLTGKVSPPPPPTSITGVPPASAAPEALAAYPPIVGGEAELMWRRAFWQTAIRYPAITIKVVATNREFGCGLAGKDLGVFYCPDERTVWVDTDAYARLRKSFPLGADYAEALARRRGLRPPRPIRSRGVQGTGGSPAGPEPRGCRRLREAHRHAGGVLCRHVDDHRRHRAN